MILLPNLIAGHLSWWPFWARQFFIGRGAIKYDSHRASAPSPDSCRSHGQARVRRASKLGPRTDCSTRPAFVRPLCDPKREFRARYGVPAKAGAEYALTRNRVKKLFGTGELDAEQCDFLLRLLPE